MSTAWDVIVVGARCAGSPLAMLMARKGYRVLVVDRARFPSDTMSTHVMQPLAVAMMREWGLLDRLVATGCPPIDTYTFDFGPLVIAGSPGTAESPVAYCPRRTILDQLLVDAAREAGAEVREEFTVEELVTDNGRVTGIKGRAKGGGQVVESARVVVGADGRHSLVAEAVQAPRYHERAPLLAPYYSYWSDLPVEGRFETYALPGRGFAAAPTHDGLTMVVGGWPFAELEAHKDSVDEDHASIFEMAPRFAERMRGARRMQRLMGAPTRNFFRKPYGDGWALVGDAGYLKDPITAQGIVDAFRDAIACANALDESFRGARGFDAAMKARQERRDEDAMPMYEMTCQIASLEPPPPEMLSLIGAMHGNQAAMDGFARMNAGTISPAEFLSPANVGSIMGAAARRA